MLMFGKKSGKSSLIIETIQMNAHTLMTGAAVDKYFPANFGSFLRIPFLENTWQPLLL